MPRWLAASATKQSRYWMHLFRYGLRRTIQLNIRAESARISSRMLFSSVRGDQQRPLESRVRAILPPRFTHKNGNRGLLARQQWGCHSGPVPVKEYPAMAGQVGASSDAKKTKILFPRLSPF